MTLESRLIAAFQAVGADVKALQGAQGGGGPTLQGDTTPFITQTKTYQITNYNSFSSYTVSASAGTASLSGDTITFTAPASPGNVSLTLTVDGQPTVFTVVVQPAPTYIPTPTPTPANFGDPLDGGFYAGMIWNELVQSATSTTIGTGSKSFSVPDMSSAPIVYEGQQLEVRSRANPANKMVGTVTGATGTSLTINVTSIGGSGTFSDWSIMSRYRVIVSPKASGENAGIALNNANTAFPVACQTLTEGLAARTDCGTGCRLHQLIPDHASVEAAIQRIAKVGRGGGGRCDVAVEGGRRGKAGSRRCGRVAQRVALVFYRPRVRQRRSYNTSRYGVACQRIGAPAAAMHLRSALVQRPARSQVRVCQAVGDKSARLQGWCFANVDCAVCWAGIGWRGHTSRLHNDGKRRGLAVHRQGKAHIACAGRGCECDRVADQTGSSRAGCH